MSDHPGILSRIYRRFSKPGRGRSVPTPRLEWLEDRSVPTVTSALNGALLNIQIVADDQKLSAYLRLQGTNLEVADNANFNNASSFTASQVGQVSVQGGNASESFILAAGTITASLGTSGLDSVSMLNGSGFAGPISITNGTNTTLANLQSTGGSISTNITAGSILLSGTIAAQAGVALNAPVILQTNVEVDGGAGSVSFGGTVDAASAGAQSLLVTSPANTIFGGSVGGKAALSTITTRSVAPLVAPTIAATTANIPLHYLPQSGNYYIPGDQPPEDPTIKYGIEVSVGENNPARMYLFDTGGQGFFPAYSQEAFGGVTLGTQSAKVQYTSGLFYNGLVTSAKVTIGSGSESVTTAVPVEFGAWPTGGDVNDPGLVFRSPTTEKTGQLFGDFGGAFGFADADTTDQSPGLASILFQLPGNYSSGYVVRLGPVGGPANLTIGITDPLRSQFPYSIPLTAASNPFNPFQPLLYPVSNRLAFEDFAFSPDYTIANGSQSYNLGQLPTICDTGAPSTSVRYPNNPPTTPFPFTNGKNSFEAGTVLSAAFPTADGKQPLTWNQTIGNQQSVDKFGYMDSTGQASSVNNVNTGLNLFNQYDVMFDVERGRIRLRPNAGIGTVTIGSVTTTGDQNFTQNINIAGGIQSSAGKLTFGGKAYITGDSSLSTSAGNPVNFQNTIDGDNSLAITSDGTVTFGGSIGVVAPLKSISVTASKTMFPVVSVATVSTYGPQSYSGDAWINGVIQSLDKSVNFKGSLHLAGASYVTSKSDEVVFDATINGDQTLSVTAQTSIRFNDRIGDSVPVAGLTLAAPIVTSNSRITLSGASANAQPNGLVISDGSSVNFTATGSAVSGFQESGILFTGDSLNSQLSGFIISENIGSGMNFASAKGNATNLSGTIVSGNTIIGNVGFGIEFSAPVSGLQLRQNVIGQAGSANPWGLVSGGPNTHGIVLAAGAYLGTVIASNTISSNRRDGIYAPGSVASLTIEGNTIQNNGAHGLEFFTGNFSGTVVSGNTITSNLGDGIALGAGIIPPAAGGNPAQGYSGTMSTSGHYVLNYSTNPVVNGIVQDDPLIHIDCPIFNNGNQAGSSTTIGIPLDTGSRALYLDIGQVAQGTPLGNNLGYVYLNSSNRIYYGNWINQTVSFPDSSYVDSSGNTVSGRKATATLPILVVTAIGATTNPPPGSTTASTTFGTTERQGSVTITNGTQTTTVPITPNQGSGGTFTVPGGWWAEYSGNMANGRSFLSPVANFGVGFDRSGQGTFPINGSANQGYNAFLNLAEMRQGAMRAGYVITPSNIILGLDNSVSGFSYTALTPTGIAQTAGSPPDWQPATGTLVYNGKGYSTGPIVIDMGIPSGIVSLPGQTATSPFNQAMTVNLLNSGGKLSYDINYNLTNNPLNPQSVNFFDPLPGNYSSNAPTQNLQFFNTGRYLFSAFNYLYDATGGYLGLLPINASVLTSANAVVPSSATFFPNPAAPTGVTGLMVGSPFPGGGNIITGNRGAGVSVNGAGSNGNAILGNTVTSNGTSGISLSGGANSGQVAPSLDGSAALRANGTVTVTGALPQQASYFGNYLVQFFLGASSPAGQPFQASTLLGAITTTAGAFSANFPLGMANFGSYVIATATPLAGPMGTSEFSMASRINTFLVTSLADAGPGTLRNAIQFTNRYAFSKTVTLQTPAGANQIFLASALPVITSPIVLNGQIINSAGQVIDKATVNGSRIPGPANGLTLMPGAAGSSIFFMGLQGFASGNGIVVRANQVTIGSNRFYNNLIGINIANLSMAIVSANTLRLSGHGILATGALSGSVVAGNSITGSRFTGIRLVNASGLAVGLQGNGNQISGTGSVSLATAGIYAMGILTGTTVQGNRIQSGGNGIILDNARRLTVGGSTLTPRTGGNTIIGNRGAGLYASGVCANSSVSGNTITGNRPNVSIGQSKYLSYLAGMPYVSPFSVPFNSQIASWTTDFPARTSAILANSTPAFPGWYGYNYAANQLGYGPLNPQLLNASGGLNPAQDRGNVVNGVPLNQAPANVNPVYWQMQRLLAAATSLIGTPYQHLHLPQFNPAQAGQGNFQWSPVSNKKDLQTSQMLINQTHQPKVPNPYAPVYGQPAAGIDCTDFSAYIYNLALGVQMHSGVVNQITFTVNGSPTTGNLLPNAVPSATVLNPDGSAVTPVFFKSPTFGLSQINQPGSLTSLTDQLQTGDLLYIGNPTDGVLHVVVWLGITGTDSAGNTFPLVISSHDNTPAIFDTAAVDPVTGFPLDGNTNGHLPPPGVQILPFVSSNWFYQDFLIAMRVLPPAST